MRPNGTNATSAVVTQKSYSSQAAQICDTFGLGISVHSSGELGIQLAAMLHLGAVLPNLVFTAVVYKQSCGARRFPPSS